MGDEIGLCARRLPELGLVGEPLPCRPPAVERALERDRIPVVTPIAVGPLNVNADEAATALAAGLGADRVAFVSDVPGVYVEGVVVDLDERKRLVENLGDCEVMILRNHGLLACGVTIGQAFNNIYRLERACETQLMAMACNSEMVMPPQSVIERSNAQLTVMPSPDASGKKRAHGSLEWPALKRMLDRRDPSYRT